MSSPTSDRSDLTVEWQQTRRVGLALGLGLTLMGVLLAGGSLNEGDPRTALWVGVPTACIAAVGTLLYFFLPRRRVALQSGVLHVNGVAWPHARMSTLGLLGEGFSTTQAFWISQDDDANEVWLSKWSFPQVQTMHRVLSEVLPVCELPPERPNPFLRRWHARQAEQEAAARKDRRR